MKQNEARCLSNDDVTVLYETGELLAMLLTTNDDIFDEAAIDKIIKFRNLLAKLIFTDIEKVSTMN
jgi:hypothetical protein